ncbi:NADH dehydrogenase [ubiquinone] 1 subunit C2 [Ceratitis capitata]|uniref:NADH dehydrogenase [ubiquinone] 1 subunit C2 n=1 Tax=Ceratitis capitata TaxID=7213 RepID=W8C6B2_CERCA|nr:NADH dehydrogenase [ubiquinone] 1 subunit C2 [Ceratitis capitata]CAD6998200.1 unnamed protein product [Ceratitis capitata]
MSNVIDPIKLLTDKGERQPSYMSNKFNPVICSILGFGCAVFMNFGLRKPPFSGIQNHAIFTLIGGGLGVFFDQKREEYLAKRDAVLRHYIELHPEDFPVKERKKYGDILEPWVPIR